MNSCHNFAVRIVMVVSTAVLAIGPGILDAQTIPVNEEATVIERGRPATDDERAYSKEYKQMYPDRRVNLSVLLELGKRMGTGEELGSSIGEPSIPTVGDTSIKTGVDFLRDVACRNDAVVDGTIDKKTSHLTDDESIIYTEFVFVVGGVLKNNSLYPFNVRDSIRVTRPGGLISVDKQVIRFEDRSYPLLETGKRYLLYLKFVPGARGYLATDSEGVFQIEYDLVKPVHVRDLPRDLRNNTSIQFFDTVRGAGASGCEKPNHFPMGIQNQ